MILNLYQFLKVNLLCYADCKSFFREYIFEDIVLLSNMNKSHSKSSNDSESANFGFYHNIVHFEMVCAY